MGVFSNIIGGYNQGGTNMWRAPSPLGPPQSGGSNPSLLGPPAQGGGTGYGTGTPASTVAPTARPTTAAGMYPLVKNQTARLLYSNLQNALSGPNMYAENDIRNQGLGVATAAMPRWDNFERGATNQAVGAGMGDSGFYQGYMDRAKQADSAQTNADILSSENQMRTANQDFNQKRLSSAQSLLAMYLDAKRKDRLTAMQLANAFGMAGS